MKTGQTQEQSAPAGSEAVETSTEQNPGNAVAELMGEVETAITTKNQTEPEPEPTPEPEPEPTPEPEPEPTPEPEPEPTPEPETDPDLIKDGEIKGLPPEVQVKLNRKIGKMTAIKKAALEEAAAEKAGRIAAEAKVAEFEARVDAETARNIAKIGLPAELLSKDEADLIAKWETLKDSRRFCLANPGGYQASGEGDDKVSYSASQVASRLNHVLDELDELGPRAAALRDSKTKLYREALALGLKAIAEKKAEARGQNPEVSGQQEPKKKAPAKPPVIPGTSTPKKQLVQKVRTAITAEEVEKAPDTREGLAALLGKSMTH